jgi:hypothetical protein
MMSRNFFKVAVLLVTTVVFSQEEVKEESKLKVDFSGYLEAFYGYDFNKPTSDKRLDWIYNHSRHNEFSINMGMLRTSLTYENVYANIAIQAGTNVDDNYSAESMKLFHEAFIGVYLDKDQKHVVEAGIMPSYIGFETSSSFSNLTLTRSIMAESSPFYFTGVKYNYVPNDKWSLAFVTTNGWQRIEKPNSKALPTFGTQVVYSPTDKTTLNWSTFIGDEPIGTDVLRTRYFNNLFLDHGWNEKWRTILGFDMGFQKSIVDDTFQDWKTVTLITQYSVAEKWNVAARAEYFEDKENVIVGVGAPFEVFGASFNVDFIPNSKLKLRTEAKWFDSKEPIFNKETGTTNSNFFLVTSLAFEF